MSDLAQRIAHLSREQRQLLLRRLKAQGERTQQEDRITRRAAAGPAPLSFAQQRLWLLDRLQPGDPAYNIPGMLRMQGQLDIAALKASLDEILHRHEVLRTRLVEADGRPVQVVESDLRIALPLVDLTQFPAGEREKELRSLACSEAHRPFQLDAAPLVRATLLRLDVDEYALVLVMHHVVSDAWSAAIVVRELSALYAAFTRGAPSPLPELPIQYGDFAAWQREMVKSDRFEKQAAYWRQQLAGAPPVLELPHDRPRAARPAHRGGTVAFQISGEVTARLRQLAREQNTTLFAVLLSAWYVVLYRYSGQRDVVIGTASAGRHRAQSQPLIGFFVNSLPLRADLSGNPGFLELLRRVHEVAWSAFANQEFPFEQLVETLALDRGLSRNPLFQVMFVLQNVPAGAIELPGLTLHAEAIESGTAKFDLLLSMSEDTAALRGALEYNADLFQRGTIDRLARHFSAVLCSISSAPAQPIDAVPLLDESDRRRILHEFNAPVAPGGALHPAVPARGEQLLHHLFEAQVQRSPQAVALEFEGSTLSFGELEARANRLAHHLRGLGVGPEARVGICLDRSMDLIIAMLGVLKAGGAYVPLEPSHPAGRLAVVMDQAKPAVVITHEEHRRLLPASCPVVRLDTERETIARCSTAKPRELATAESLAYAIFTSGSTGSPKGVMNEHRGVVNRLTWMQDRFAVAPPDRVVHKTPFGFDVSIWEIFWPLITGGTLIITRPGGHKDTGYLAELVRQRGATLLHFVPSMLGAFLSEPAAAQCKSVRRVLCSGEALTAPLEQQVFERLDCELHNLYGPTEAAIEVTHWQCEPHAPRHQVPLGRPIDKVKLHILDNQFEPVPIGVPGDLYIGGIAVARGYLGRPDLTAAAFLPDPYTDRPGARLYRTGDRARYLADGNIDYLGRRDDQIKLRGQRMELGEIEAALTRLPAIRQAAAALQSDGNGQPHLVAYVVRDAAAGAGNADGTSENAAWSAKLQQLLKQQLPEYMVPERIAILETLPHTLSGKLDRGRLPTLSWHRADGDNEFAAPQTPLEQLLAGAWERVLGVERVGVHDNFFAIGGHSLLATQVLSHLRSSLKIDLPLRTLFESPTVREFAARIDAAQADGAHDPRPLLHKADRNKPLPLSFAQRRLWFLDQLQPGSAAYNMPLVLRVSGELNLGVLDRVLQEIIRRHEVLRTTVDVSNGEPLQHVHAPGPFGFSLIDLGALAGQQKMAEARRLAYAEARRPFDLQAGPLVRGTLIRLEQRDHVVLLTMHHIVCDGWSLGVLTRELAAFYRALVEGRPAVLPDLPVQYADYAAWQQEWLTGQRLESQLDYWRKQLAGAPDVTRLPLDRPRTAATGSEAARHPVALSLQTAEQLQQLSREAGATLYMTLLSAFGVLLSYRSEQEDMVIGSPVAGRSQRETQPLVGFFVNTLALRLDLAGDPTFAALLARIRETALDAYAHQDIPYEMLVEALQLDRSGVHNPLFQSWFVLQNAPLPPLDLPGLQIAPQTGLEDGEPDASIATRHDLKLDLTQTDQGLQGSMEYRQALFDASTIAQMAGQFEQIIGLIVDSPDIRLSEIKQQLDAAAEQHFASARRQKLASLNRRAPRSRSESPEQSGA